MLESRLKVDYLNVQSRHPNYEKWMRSRGALPLVCRLVTTPLFNKF